MIPNDIIEKVLNQIHPDELINLTADLVVNGIRKK